MTWDRRVPFDPKTGDVMHYPRNIYTPDGILPPVWRENSEFEDTLTFVQFDRGRSAAYAVFQRLDGSRCAMFLTDLDDAIPRMAQGRLVGRFTWCKRGQNFGIKLMPGVRPLVQPVQATALDGQSPKAAGCGYLTRSQQQIHAGDRR